MAQSGTFENGYGTSCRPCQSHLPSRACGSLDADPGLSLIVTIAGPNEVRTMLNPVVAASRPSMSVGSFPRGQHRPMLYFRRWSEIRRTTSDSGSAFGPGEVGLREIVLRVLEERFPFPELDQLASILHDPEEADLIGDAAGLG
jgi:hypothetical protein